MSAIREIIVCSLDALQLLMLFVGTLTYKEPKLFRNGTFVIIKILSVFKMNVCIYIHIFSYRIMVGAVALNEVLLLCSCGSVCLHVYSVSFIMNYEECGKKLP
jgi:hypothetical protein